MAMERPELNIGVEISTFQDKVGEVCLPGDHLLDLADIENISDGDLHFGPGIRQDGRYVVACKAGFLRKKETPLCYWIDTNHQKRYVPMKNDAVIGIITSRGVDSFKVDIGASKLANLNNLAFEGSTKKYRPNLKMNELVFSKLTVANKDMEPEMTCIDENNRSNNLGPLNDGYMFTVSLGLCRQLLRIPECRILKLLGKYFPFEITIGMNGRVWINSKGIIDMIAIANAIVSSEFMEDNQISIMVNQLVESITGIVDDEEEDGDDAEYIQLA